MCVYPIPAGKTAVFGQGYVGISKTGPSREASFAYYVRPFGGVFQIKGEITCNNSGSGWWKYSYFTPEGPIPEKSDIVLTCTSVSSDSTKVVGGFDLRLYDNDDFGQDAAEVFSFS